MKFVVCIFVTLVSLANCQSIQYKDCGSQVGQIKDVSVFPCDTFPCELHKGQSYTVNVTFTITETTDQSFASVEAEVFGAKVPFDLPHPDACEGGISGLNCPLQSGSTYVYTASLPVLEIYPSIKVVVDWTLADKKSDGNVIFCFSTLLAIVS